MNALSSLSRSLPVLLTLLLAACGGPDPSEKSLAATGKSIALAYESLSATTGELKRDAGQLCQKTSAPQVEAARQAWRRVMADWQAAQAVRFGPIRSDDRMFRIQFWPDPRDLVASKIRALLKYDPSAPLPDLGSERIGESSVALQGLPAVEYLLYGDQEAPGVIALRFAGDPQRCELLVGVAGHLQTVTAELYQDWLKQPERLTEYGDQTGLFANRQAAVTALLNSIIETGEIIAGSKLGWPLGQRADGRPQPARVESRRSGLSLENIQHNLAGMQRLLTAGGTGGLLDIAVYEDLDPARVERIRSLLAESQTQAGSIEPALYEGLVSASNLEPYKALLANVEALNQILTDELAPALGVQVGFNFNDGD